MDILKKNFKRKKSFHFLLLFLPSMYITPNVFLTHLVITTCFYLEKRMRFFMNRLRHLDATVIILYCRLMVSNTEDTYTRPSTANVFDLPKQTEGP